MLYKNKWEGIRWSHRAGTVVKATWFITLVVRAFTSPGTIMVALIWGLILSLQVLTFIFIPTPRQALEGLSDGRVR